MDVRVGAPVVGVHRLDHLRRLLRGRGVVEVGDGAPLELAREQREVPPDLLDAEGGLCGERLHQAGAASCSGVLLAHPLVALVLELARELGPAALDHATVQHDVDEVRLDVAQDPLVVGDDQDAKVRAAHLLDRVGDGPQGVDVESRVGLVHDRDERLEDRHLEDFAALLLAAREALVEVAACELAVHAEHFHLGLERLAELLQADRILPARLALRVDRGAQEVDHRHAGDRGRVLKRHEEARAGALVGLGLGDVLALEADAALGDLVGRVAQDRVRERRLAGPVRAHQRVHLAAADGQVHAAEDLLVLDGDVQVLNL